MAITTRGDKPDAADAPLFASASTNIGEPSETLLTDGYETQSEPGSAEWNWLMNFVSAGVVHNFIYGIAEFDSTETYQLNSYTNYGGVIYKSLVSDNTGNTPANGSSYWGAVEFDSINVANGIIGDLTGNVTGNVTGDLTGNVDSDEVNTALLQNSTSNIIGFIGKHYTKSSATGEELFEHFSETIQVVGKRLSPTGACIVSSNGYTLIITSVRFYSSTIIYISGFMIQSDGTPVGTQTLTATDGDTDTIATQFVLDY